MITEEALKASFQENSITCNFKPSCTSFFQLIATLGLISVLIFWIFLFSSLIGNFRWLERYAIFLIPLFCATGIVFYFLFYKNLSVTLDGTGVERLSLFSSKKVKLESIRNLILYRYEYPMIMPPQFCHDRLILARCFLKIVSDNQVFYLSDNMIGFEEFIYNLKVLTKKMVEDVSETKWIDIFKF